MSRLLTADRHAPGYLRSWQAEPIGVSQTVERSRRQPPTGQSPSWREDVFKQLRKFLTYRENWNGYGERPIRREVVQVAEKLIMRIGRNGPEPLVFPHPRGGVQIEWLSGDAEIEIEVLPENLIHIFISKAGSEIESDDPPVHDPIWHHLHELISKMK